MFWNPTEKRLSIIRLIFISLFDMRTHHFLQFKKFFSHHFKYVLSPMNTILFTGIHIRHMSKFLNFAFSISLKFSFISFSFCATFCTLKSSSHSFFFHLCIVYFLSYLLLFYFNDYLALFESTFLVYTYESRKLKILY